MRTAGDAHVVIVGGGFAGLYAARRLGRAGARVTLIDRRNHHLFLPLLYQVATAGLNPSDISAPIRRVLRRDRNTTVFMDEVEGIDPGRRRVRLSEQELEYDYLILASGSAASYFGNDGWAVHAPGLLDVNDALEIRSRILMAYERAERRAGGHGEAESPTFVVVGGGPTGVELAGAIAEMSRLAMARDFRRVSPSTTRVILLEGSDRILEMYPESLSRRAEESLRDLGVEVRTGTKVTSIEEGRVGHDEGEIEADGIFWAAGVRASALGETLGVDREKSGRIPTEPDLSVPGHPEVFVAGDLAHVVREDGRPVPALAPAAIQMGRHAASNVLRLAGGKEPRPFRYRDRGMLATIGRASAVADLRGLKLWGFVAWLTWIVVHIFFLIGFRNRFIVMFQWAWAYLTYERGARLVTDVHPDESSSRPG